MKKINLILLAIILIACEGEQGEIGLTGSNSLINTSSELAGDNCPSGGFKIDVGVDTNNNGVLDTDEIQSTQYICNGDNGSNGQNSLVNVADEPAGDNCSSGGFKIDVGVDTNNNGVLDTDEIQSTQYICNGDNGSNGQNSLVNVTDEPAGDNCSSGGFRIDVGVDTNNNGVLDTDEIQSTKYICNGDGSNEIRLDFNMASNAVWSTSTSMIIWEFNGIPDFNIQNFQGVDSVAFGAYIQSADAATNCILELYDETRDVVIANSDISTNSTSYAWVTTSSNFLSEFPEEPIDLRMRLTSDNGASVSFRIPKLILLWE